MLAFHDDSVLYRLVYRAVLHVHVSNFRQYEASFISILFQYKSTLDSEEIYLRFDPIVKSCDKENENCTPLAFLL